MVRHTFRRGQDVISIDDVDRLYLLRAGRDLRGRSDGGWTKYVANEMRLARADFDPIVGWPVHYYLSDAIGSTRQLRDVSRNLVFSADYEPFGKAYNVWPDPSAEAYKFTGEKHDDPTGLVYLRARQYGPDLGRFVRADPILGGPFEAAED